MLLNLGFNDPYVLVVNIIIVLFLVSEIYNGYKNGFLESGIRLIGEIIAIVAAYILAKPLGVILYDKLPFFKFSGLFEGVYALNIILYEVIAFFIVLTVLMIAVKVIVKATGLVQKALSFIMLFGVPNKILGSLLGLVRGLVILYFAVFVLKFGANLFGFTVKESLADDILNVPVLKQTFGSTVDSLNSISELAHEYKDVKNKEEFNDQAMDILLKYDIISEKNLDILINSGKISYSEETGAES
jgi:uncharacterized membrane protein required for colicin V production